MSRAWSSALFAVVFSVVLTLSGCGTGFVNAVPGSPTTVTSPVTTPAAVGLGIQDYGGHAPLVGAHVYLVQLGAPSAQVASGITQTYGSVVKSLLTINGKYTSTPVYSGTPALPYTYPLTTNVNDQFVPPTDLVGQPFKYVTTNQFGESYITGDYACTPGYPVMLIGYGGSPSYYGAGPNTVTVTGSNIYFGTVGGVSGGILTFFTSSQLYYTGESISVTSTNHSYDSVNTGVTQTALNGANGATSGVLSGGEVSNYTGPAGTQYLTSTQFSVFIPGYTTGGTGNAGDVGTATGTPAFNPAATNMAMLGLCPTSGNFSTGSTAINYIYMNEVSTTAAAYALAQFTNPLASGQSGYDEFHIGAPVGNLVGLQNAAITAGLLYDIQGGNIGTGTSFDGENHTARTTTPCPAMGACAAGVVPNSQINMIANSLAACVDSANIYYWSGAYAAPTSGNYQSTACRTLGLYAQDNGYLDTTAPTHYAFNIAQAAFSMARFPQGLGTATTSGGANNGAQTLTAGTSATATSFVSAIFNLPAGSNTPFMPTLRSAPNDLSVGIQWSPGGTTNDVEIDAYGNAWAQGGAISTSGNSNSAQSYSVYELTPGGGLQTYTAASGLSQAISSGLAIDSSNNVWSPGVTGIYKFTPGMAAGVQLGAANSANGGAIAVDGAFNQYIPSGNDGANAGAALIAKQDVTGAAAGGNFPILGTANPCATSVGYVALDSTGNIWSATSQNSAVNNSSYVCRFSSAGAQQYSFNVPSGVSGQYGNGVNNTGFAFPRGLATDRNDNVWFADKNLDALYSVAKGSTTSNSGTSVTTLHGQLSAPSGVAVDGANTIWVSNTGDTGAQLNGNSVPKYGTGLVQFANTGTVITPTYITGGTVVSSATVSTSLATAAIDQSGNVWSAADSQTPGGATPVAAVLIYELVGLAAPTTNPVAKAKASGTTGTKPGLPVGQVTVYNIGNGGANVFQGYIPAGAPFYVGETVTLSGFATSTFLNGVTFTITSVGVGGPGLFTANYTHANVGVTNENGLASALN